VTCTEHELTSPQASRACAWPGARVRGPTSRVAPGPHTSDRRRPDQRSARAANSSTRCARTAGGGVRYATGAAREGSSTSSAGARISHAGMTIAGGQPYVDARRNSARCFRHRHVEGSTCSTTSDSSPKEDRRRCASRSQGSFRRRRCQGHGSWPAIGPGRYLRGDRAYVRRVRNGPAIRSLSWKAA